MFNIKFINKIKSYLDEIKKSEKRQAGMTYVELIVVMSIFGTMSSIVMFNYDNFRARIDIKNLSSDVALSIVKAQKNSVSGKLPPTEQLDLITPLESWRPSYGVYFNLNNSSNFIYFTDINMDHFYNSPDELYESFTMNNNNKIKSLKYVGSSCNQDINELTISFKRPSSTPIFTTNPVVSSCLLDHFEIKLGTEQNNFNSDIFVYPNGRLDLR